MNNSPSAFAFFALVFVAIWTTARLMGRADGRRDVGTTVAALALLYVAPFGVWLLRKRILGIAEMAPDEDSPLTKPT